MRFTVKAAALIGLGAAVLLLTGCGIAPKQARFVSHADQLRAPGVPKVDLDLAWRDDQATLADYPCLLITPPKMAPPLPEGLDRIPKLMRHLTRRMKVHFMRLGLFTLVTSERKLADMVAPTHRVCRLELAVTDVVLGNGLTRYFLGCNAGGVEVQLEGRFVDDKTDRVLMEFVDRRIDSGNPTFGLNFRAFDARYLVAKNMGVQSYHLSNYVAHLIGQHRGPVAAPATAPSPPTKRAGPPIASSTTVPPVQPDWD